MFFERFGDVGGYFFRFGAGFKDCVAALEVGFYALVAERDASGLDIVGLLGQRVAGEVYAVSR